MSDDNLESLVQAVAKDWKDNPYYKRAEDWTHIFWDQNGSFRPLFERLDLGCVIELACGHGRHSEQIIGRAGNIILMDVQPENLEASRTRLGGRPDLQFLTSNGYDFQPVENNSVTAIFCYDAMVHFHPDVVAAYLKDTCRVLQPGGLALYHHSNYDAPPERRYDLNPHGRNRMTYGLFKELTAAAGLKIIESNPIRWGYDEDLDRASLLGKN